MNTLYCTTVMYIKLHFTEAVLKIMYENIIVPQDYAKQC